MQINIDIQQLIAWLLSTASGVILGLIFFRAFLEKVVGEQIYLRTQTNLNKELEELRRGHSIEIEKIRAEFVERRDSIKIAQDASMVGHRIAQERVISAIELLWQQIREVRDWALPACYVYWFMKTQPNTDSLKLSPIFKILDADYTQRFFKFEKSLEGSRPFLGEHLWDAYMSYLIFVGSLVEKAVLWKESGKVIDLWKDKDGKLDERATFGPFSILGKERLDELMKVENIHASSAIISLRSEIT